MNTRNRHFFGRFAFACTAEQFFDERELPGFSSVPVHMLNAIPKPELGDGGMRGNGTVIEKLVRRSVQDTIQLNYAWLRQMSDPELQLREKMTLFWHDHFACRSLFAYLSQQQNNTIRRNALGSFRTLLMEVAKDPAMLQFLNNQQNKKDHPNENFAREVMELFTVGRGFYSENDVREAARAFTGWAFNPLTAGFVFRPRMHDSGIKTFRGKKGAFTGEDIINMLLDDPQTARHITRKLWSFLVSTESYDEEIIEELAGNFYQSDYQIGSLLEGIASSGWFYRSEFMGNRIKSPVELLAGIQVQTGGTIGDQSSAVFIQRALGQVLFNPPNVGGWPSGQAWIDSSSLTHRLNLATVLINGLQTDLDIGDDGDALSALNGNKKLSLKLDTDWLKLSTLFHDADQVEQFLLSRPTTRQNREKIMGFASNASDPSEFVKRLFQGFMSVPEYQLC